MIANLLRVQTPDVRVFLMAILATMTFVIMREFAVVTVLPMLLLVPFLSTFRVSPFELTVPVTAGQVFTARLLTSLLAMMTPIVVWIVAWLVRDPATFAPDIVVASAGGAALLALVPLALRPRDAVPPRPKQLLLLVVSVVAVEVVLWYFAPVALTAAVSGVLFAMILVRTWRALPPSYVIDPVVQGTTPHARLTVAPVANSTIATTRARELPFFLWLVKEHYSRVTLFMLILALLSGVAGNSLFMLVILLSMLISSSRARLLFTHLLPLSPRQRFAATAVAAVIVPTLLLGLGSAIRSELFPRNSMYSGSPTALPDDYDRDESASRVPFEFWAAAESGIVPSIESPWGEQAKPWSVRFFGRTWYNPYSVISGNSERFRDWQFERATTAVYGKPIARAVYNRDRSALPAPITRSASMTILKGATVVALLLLLVVSLDLGRIRAVNRYSAFRYTESAAFVLLLAAMFGPGLYYGQYLLEIVPAFVSRTLLHLTGWLPNSIILVGLIPVVPVALVWRFAEWVHSKTEIDKQDFVIAAAAKS